MTGSVINDFFGPGSPYLTHPLLTAERTAFEVDEIESLVGPIAGRVLDIGCGFGRHSIEIASRGADVTGIDLSKTMIDQARDRAASAGQFVDFDCIDAADFADVARYDLAICLFTTLGQLAGSSAGNDPHVEMLHRAKRALRPGGSFVVEVPERERAVAALVESELLGPTRATRSFDSATSVICERFELESGDVFNLAYRVFSKTELVDLFHDVGFAVRHVLDRGLTEPPTTMMTIAATRPA